MFKLIALAFSVLFAIIPTAALAQSPEAQRAVEFCEAKYPGSSSSARLQQIICIQDENIKILQDRLLKGEGSVGAELARLRKELEATKAELARVRDAPSPAPGGDRPDPSVTAARAANDRRLAEIRARGGSQPARAPERPAARTVPPAPAAPVAVPPPVAYVGTPHTVVSVPGQYAASTFEPSTDHLEITGLSLGVHEHVWGARQVRIIVKLGSSFLPIGHDQPRLLCGNVTPWNEIYGDLDRDGKAERLPFKAVDPSEVDSLYISNVRGLKDLEIVYLVPTGKAVLVPGCEPQTLWGNPVRVRMDKVSSGTWHMPAVNGRKL